MAIMPKMQLALNDCSVYGSVARRIGNKMTYDVTRQTIKLALCLGLDSVKVGTNDLHNEFLAEQRQRELDRETFNAMGHSDEPDDDVKPFLTFSDGMEMACMGQYIWVKVAEAGIMLYRPTFQKIMNNRMKFFMSDPTPDNVLAERRMLLEEGRTPEEVSGLPDGHFVRIIRDTRKRLAEYDNERRDSALELFTKWTDDAVPTCGEYEYTLNILNKIDEQARNRAYNDCLKNGLYGQGKQRIDANTDKVLMESLYDDCAGEYLNHTA
mgnify:FL=1